MSEVTQLDRIEAMLKRLIAQTAAKRPGEDEKVFKDPKKWDGASYIGSQMSECPADYLRAYAKYKGACAYMCRKEADPSKLQYAERDERTAKLAIEWATWRESLSEEPQAPAAKTEDFGSAADGGDIPF